MAKKIKPCPCGKVHYRLIRKSAFSCGVYLWRGYAMLKAIKTSKNKIYIGEMKGGFVHILRKMPQQDRLDTLHFGFSQFGKFNLIGIVGIEQLQIMLEKTDADKD